MLLSFHIKYRTAYGEELVLHLALSAATPAAHYRMSTTDGQHWHCDVTLAPQQVRGIDAIPYYYTVERGGSEERREWTALTHRLELTAAKATRYELNDRWADTPQDTYLYTSAFTRCLSRHRLWELQPTPYVRTLRIKVRAPQLRSGQTLVLVGDTPGTGAWDVRRAIPMREYRPCEWTADIDADTTRQGALEFKFVAVGDDSADAPLWETGHNRTLQAADIPEFTTLCREMDQAFFEIPDRRVAGTLVPVFSLRTEESFGVGDFGDLQRMIEWVAATGQRVLQMLPICDTTRLGGWADSYPYSCTSVFALHPQYACLHALPPLADPVERERMERERLALEALPEIDYERMMAAKSEYLHLIYAQEGERMMATPDFRRFFQSEQQWLVPYARYCMLRDEHRTTQFSSWTGHARWDEGERTMLSRPRNKVYRRAAYYYWLQYVLATQMSQAHALARRLGVVLKGDIPIGVSPDSCDVWMYPEYFHTDSQTGAPPDYFSQWGQNWGFPTYDWPQLIAGHCQWWQQRLQVMQHYFDAYRIDHVLGFFRIWEIPASSVHAISGQFAPALAFTPAEIEQYGLPWQQLLYTQPYITTELLGQLLPANQVAAVCARYLRLRTDGRWDLLPQYATQRQIEAAVEPPLREALYALPDQVLFLHDHRDRKLYHPRIEARQTALYRALTPAQRQAFDRLYDDYYYHRNEQYWYHEAMRRLPAVTGATDMLACAEDLGFVPACVAWVMDRLRILSLQIQTMPKEGGVRFGDTTRFPYRSVTVISSHDMPTLRIWWDEDPERAQDYYAHVLRHSGPAPHPLPGWLAREVVALHLQSPAMLAIIALQDWLATDETLRRPDAGAERVNEPANPRHHWRYRMHLPIQALLKAEGLNASISQLINKESRV